MNYFNDYRRTNSNSAYFQWSDASAIQQLINKQPATEPINLIGHSYGAFTAAQVAGTVNRKVDLLITIDPVRRANPGNFVGNVLNWVNVTATPSSPNASDFVAFVGGRGGNLPTAQATSTYSVDANHEDFARMMSLQPPEMASPRSLLGVSRTPSMPGLGGIVNPFSSRK